MWTGTTYALAAGMILEAFSMLSGKWQKGDAKVILITFAFGLFGMFPGKSEEVYDLKSHLFISCVMGAVFFVSAFRERLVSRVGARTLLIINILLLFLVYERFGLSYNLFWILLIPSFVTLINGFSNIS